MSERFVLCVHCGQHHDFFASVCPRTGKPMRTQGGLPRAPLPSVVSDSVTTSPMARRDLLGKTISGKYYVKNILGQGGMGTVYEAVHNTIGREVAVKVLHPKQMRKKDAVKRFHHEARAAGAIGHPNICEVYDLGTLDDGCPYLVMEKLVGKTLADRIKEEGGLPIDDVLDVLTQVLSGLVAAHEKNIVHRDIKPENVFLTDRVGCPPVAKLLDFGVSKMIGPVIPPIEGEDEMDLTRTGMVMGTPYYMSPEQARGDRNLDARVDLYASGVLLYEAVTGKRPFVGNNYNTLLLNILSTKARPARELRPDLSPALERVIDKAISKRREDRYQSAAEFQRDLQRIQAVPRPPASRRAPDPPKIVELPSDVLSTPSSVDVPSAGPPRKGGAGFDDLPTELGGLADFSDSDDLEPATTLMKDEEIARLARRARRPSSPSMPEASQAMPVPKIDAPRFNPNISEVTKTAVRRPQRKHVPLTDPEDNAPTEKMSREEALKNIPAQYRKAPKTSR
jgi:serine/threonine protein kinase